MFESNVPSESQIRLLESLEQKILIESIPKPSLKVPVTPINLARGGRGSIEDHMRIINNYVCSCGQKIDCVDHLTKSKSNGTALDIYKMKCQSCGDDEEVSFLSMRSALQQLSQVDITKNKTQFPYL